MLRQGSGEEQQGTELYEQIGGHEYPVSKVELYRYRQLAHAEGMSLSQLIRAVVGQYTHQKLVSGKADMRRIAVPQPREAEPIWQLQPMRRKAGGGSMSIYRVTHPSKGIRPD